MPKVDSKKLVKAYVQTRILEICDEDRLKYIDEYEDVLGLMDLLSELLSQIEVIEIACKRFNGTNEKA